MAGFERLARTELEVVEAEAVPGGEVGQRR
jgi:hypothetical protein